MSWQYIEVEVIKTVLTFFYLICRIMHIGCSSHPTVERVLPIESDFYFCFIGINQIGWNKELPTLIFCIATYLTKVTQPFLPIKCFLCVLPLPLPCHGPEPWPRPPPLLEVRRVKGSRVLVLIAEFSKLQQALHFQLQSLINWRRQHSDLVVLYP